MSHAFDGQLLSSCELREPIVAIVRLPINGMFPPLDIHEQTRPGEMVRPLQQVTLRPDKFSRLGYIRLGDTPNDEANCWISPQHVEIVEVLGRAIEDKGAWKCEPFSDSPSLAAA